MNYLKEYTSPLGTIYLKSDGTYLTGLWFKGSYDDIKNQADCLKQDLPIFNETIRWLDIYFSGQNPNFIPPYKLENITPFRKMVTDIMNEIPYGTVITYNDIAKKIAQIKNIPRMSAQAVGGAVGSNPICLIIPCHRVVGSNNSLTGYGGGIKNKVALLKLEGLDMTKYTIPTKGTKL